MQASKLNRAAPARVRPALRCALALTWAWSSAALAQSELYEKPDLKAIERSFVQLADGVRPSVVAIRTYRQLDPDDRSALIANSHGSGVIIRSDGTILTNDHVLAGADVIKAVLHDGSEHDGRLIQHDVRSDMAMFKIDAGTLVAARFGDAGQVRVGQWCFAVGNPFGIAYDSGQPAVTHGTVSALGRNLSHMLDDSDTRYYGDLIQTSSAINPGNSGGPLFDIDGNMIGLVTAIVSRSGVTEGMGFAIPMDARTRRIIDLLIAGQIVQYGYLGVEVRPVRTQDGLTGALISKVSDRAGPAARGNLRADDVIVEFGGTPIRNSDQLVRVVGATPVGTQAQVRYVRGGHPQETTVTVAERPGLETSEAEPRETDIRTLPWRGAVLAEMDDRSLKVHGVARSEAGLVVVTVEPGDARSAGLKPGDVVLTYNGARVRTLAEFIEAERRDARAIKLNLRGGRSVRMRR